MRQRPFPSLSRWGQSSYETDADLAAEAAALEPLAALRGFHQDAEILVVTSGTRVDRLLLNRAPSARLVITTTSGYDHLDRSLLAARGVAAARLPLVRRDAVVEASLELLVAGLRRSGWLRAASRRGQWARSTMPTLGMRTLRGSRVGVVGLGVIGSRMVEVLTLLGADVVATDPAVRLPGVATQDLDGMLASCDAITLHCHLTEHTRGLLSRTRLAKARRGLVVVNTARGGLVDVEAAVSLLANGTLAAVGLDVFPEEPFPHLALAEGHPDLLLTPHAAGFHDDLCSLVRQGLVATVDAWRAGQPLPHPVPAGG